MSIAHTRAMVTAALTGALDDVEYAIDPVFGFETPTSCPDVPSDLLSPRGTWEDPTAYDSQAHRVAEMFATNFAQFENAPAEIKAAGPVIR